VLSYQNTVLAAQEDVENALAAFVYGKRIAAALEQAAVSARRTTALALIQYKEGQVGFTPLLNAYDSQLQVEDALAQSRGQVLLGLISVYRALGGGWQTRAGQGMVSESVANEMRQRTDWGDMLPADGDGAQAPPSEEDQPQ
jgi:outer membrane protein TolC